MSSKRSKQRSRKKKPKKQPKFMSLNNHDVPQQQQPPPPPQPSHLAAEPEENDPHVACLLDDSNQASCMPTITDLFAPSAASSSSVVNMDEALSPASPSVEWDGGDGLARRALKGRERWVFCLDEIHHHHQQQQMGLLQLKLDYDEVMTAWSDRSPPYIDGDGPQIVPELQLHHNVFVEVGNGGGWRVPEIMEAAEGKERSTEGERKGMNREERVMRYKAKRQSRLFSKRIRYQVRKLNAEKRPRIKGRFVKRVDDM